jgi:hypothetical protein
VPRRVSPLAAEMAYDIGDESEAKKGEGGSGD